MAKNNDYLVVYTALQLLSSPSKWNKNGSFGDECIPDASSLSLGCALEAAQIKIKGKRSNRSREMGVVRPVSYTHLTLPTKA